MRREQTLRRQESSLRTLEEAIDAMKSLSAHHLRAARAGLMPARAYRAGIDAAVAGAGITQAMPRHEVPAVLVVAADLGLCDGYNSRLVEAVEAARRDLSAAKLYGVGRKAIGALHRAGVHVDREYGAATSVAGLTSLLLRLADDVLGDYLEGGFTSLYAVSARFDGVGAFTPVRTRVLPIGADAPTGQRAVTPYVSARHLAQAAIREYLYSTLFELLLDGLASEHGTRLVATESAGTWLDERVRDVRRQLSSVRREASTQEVLEVAAGARQRRRRDVV